MKIRELTAGEQSACRAKATQKVTELLNGLGVKTAEDLENLSEGNFDALHTKFNAVMKNYDSCRVNFTGDEYTPRDAAHVERSEDELLLVRQGCATAEVMAHGILDAMKASNLSKVNGTSAVFRECAGRLGLEIAPDGTTFIASDIVSERALAL